MFDDEDVFYSSTDDLKCKFYQINDTAKDLITPIEISVSEYIQLYKAHLDNRANKIRAYAELHLYNIAFESSLI